MLDVLAGALMLLVLASLVARYSRRARHSTVLLALLGPYSIGLVAISVVLLLVAGTVLAAAATAIVGLVVLGVQVQPWLARRPGPSAVPVLTVLTANLWEGRGDATCVLDLAREHHVDVLALQEVTPETIARLQAAGIDAEYPYALAAPAERWNGVALFSRHPLRDPEVSTRGDLLRAEAIVSLDPQHPDRDPSVMTVHIHAPWPPRPQMWRDQLDELRDDLRRRERPAVIAGDFNATLDHKPFRDILGDGVHEAVVDARAWWVRTYRPTLPAIWIDHVVVRGLRGVAASTHRVPGSDHRAVVVTLGRADTQPV
jgi:endonuclease/exonuclease/phosphatase (EEP) superfamily protein YafD